VTKGICYGRSWLESKLVKKVKVCQRKLERRVNVVLDTNLLYESEFTVEIYSLLNGLFITRRPRLVFDGVDLRGRLGNVNMSPFVCVNL
jgi:hypothetical protein